MTAALQIWNVKLRVGAVHLKNGILQKLYGGLVETEAGTLASTAKFSEIATANSSKGSGKATGSSTE